MPEFTYSVGGRTDVAVARRRRAPGLLSPGNKAGTLARLADSSAGAQLHDAAIALEHSSAVPANGGATEHELRFLAERLPEYLHHGLNVAEFRDMRLHHGHNGAGE
ncbi:hypothetical protein [Streptomyces johnsoniae]|uniref:Uncharacterized protein n=1 Tax=Streptomyces johnsoniae TaxID=3075532 RepID=A0ABU2SC37_9ACTN|nr:hypothetical protein [Streptomyces sp. DSM 41886]MDT0446530.1 hypothetical protein [Streptomyces sp. DSM 41886]